MNKKYIQLSIALLWSLSILGAYYATNQGYYHEKIGTFGGFFLSMIR